MWYPEDKKKMHNISIGENATIAEVLKSLRVPLEQINIVLKNGRKAAVDDGMNEGDEIDISPIIAGG